MTEGCICPRLPKDEPRVYGIRAGFKGQRISTDPDCPVHRAPNERAEDTPE